MLDIQHQPNNISLINWEIIQQYEIKTQVELRHILLSVLNIRPSWLFLERLRLRNRLLSYDIFDIFLDYPLVYKSNKPVEGKNLGKSIYN